MTNKIQIQVNIHGRVQGVFFRAETKTAADKLDIKGYVKNLPDQSVEAVFEGEQPLVDQMVEWCHKGSVAAIVEKVLAQTLDTISDFETFEIRY